MPQLRFLFYNSSISKYMVLVCLFSSFPKSILKPFFSKKGMAERYAVTAEFSINKIEKMKSQSLMNVLKVSLKIWKINLIIHDKIVLSSKEGGRTPPLPHLGISLQI